MKFRYSALILLAVMLMFAMTSCTPWMSGKITDLRERVFGYNPPDFVDSTVKVIDKSPKDTNNPVSDTGIPENSVESEIDTLFSELSEDHEIYRFNNDNCAVLYNEKDAYILDFTAERITPVTDIEEMYAAADPTGRGREYFNDYRIEYEFSERETQLHLFFTVYSNTEEAYFSVYGYYYLNGRIYSGTGIPDIKNRSFVGFYKTTVSYPGCDEPFTVTSLDDYAKLGLYEDQYLLICTRAFIENDIATLEECMGVEDGLLSVWEGVAVSDYTLTNPYPNLPGAYTLRMIANISGSQMERYPDGQYIITIFEGLGVEMEIVPVTASSVAGVMSDVEKWVYMFAESYGGWYGEDMLNPENRDFAHHMLDFFGYINRMKGISDTLTGEEYKAYSEKYLGFTDFENEYTSEGQIEHYGHGGVGQICEVKTLSSASGVHIIEVTYFADPMRSVVALVKRFTAVELGDGEYRIDLIETVFETNHHIYGWST